MMHRSQCEQCSLDGCLLSPIIVFSFNAFKKTVSELTCNLLMGDVKFTYLLTPSDVRFYTYSYTAIQLVERFAYSRRMV